MAKKNSMKIVAALILGAMQAFAAASTPTHLAAADQLVTTLRTQGDNGIFTDATGTPLNRYGAAWADAYVFWGPTARAYAQCNNFMTLLLQNSYPGWTAKGAGFSSASPTAAMYHDAIEGNLYGFQKVSNFSNILPGDLLVAKYFDGSDNTGHVMLVRGAQAMGTDGAGVTTWQIEVIDCSKSNHSQDTRVFNLGPNTTFATGGVGRGLMQVFTKNGAILAYTWSLANGSPVYYPAARHLTLGRLSN
ncbi:hypothetical protein [Fimbriimonas ginsengisoli]|uniref:Peptidase C51 domain-containing protein n=1 Tax=Fimbriimonas ginsengisoli Gsoil 348 TaxID=661478 RepID=A0A068NQH2_FIMGI|nr:hypothetical protein [Fimbriimonas ginsengisoli]AIE85671.1 hypothetical protein OP10G_2303 [Fimbriimonas ginsengisoli Gsoil 348]